MEPNNQNPVEAMATHKKVGPIIVVLVVVLIIVIVGLYIFASKIDNGGEAWVEDAPAVQEIEEMTNTSDDPQALVDDLDRALEGLDAQTF